MEDHSVRGYLNRRTTEELEGMLQYYLQEHIYKNYEMQILAILDILEERFVPDFTSEQFVRAKEFLLRYKKKD